MKTALRLLVLLLLLTGPVYALYCLWRYWPG